MCVYFHIDISIIDRNLSWVSRDGWKKGKEKERAPFDLERSSKGRKVRKVGKVDWLVIGTELLNYYTFREGIDKGKRLEGPQQPRSFPRERRVRER